MVSRNITGNFILTRIQILMLDCDITSYVNTICNQQEPCTLYINIY